MYRYQAMGSVALCIAALACDRRTEVQQDSEDLNEAKRDVARVTQQLENELAEAKAEVARLEEKLVMARQGVTDEVLEERKELQESLQEQQRRVQGEINEAKREAQTLNRDTDVAAEQLEGTRVPERVETKVTTETEVVEGQPARVQQVERGEYIPVKGVSAADAGANVAPAPASERAPR